VAIVMTPQLIRLSESDLRSIATALRSGRLQPPFPPVALQRVVSTRLSGQLANELQGLHAQDFTPEQIATTIDLLLQDRSQRALPEDVIDLVTTGPEAGTSANRDTSVVVRELFANAEHSVLIAGYAVYQGQRVFQALADRMFAKPELTVRMFLDVRRNAGDTSSADEVVRNFGERFRCYEWPQQRPLPELFYFPMSLEESPEKRAALHAKCVVIDGRAVFVSSANFTQAVHTRNIEVGLLIHSPLLAERLTGHFESMLSEGVLRAVFG
jgi:phosphatidylserine/phosphatidylglycerophosphate/cardiolipin synthase-like enzyme